MTQNLLRFLRRLFRRRTFVRVEAKDITGELSLKIHSRCDLACPRCYMFEDGQPLRPRPRTMGRNVVLQVAKGLRRYMKEHKLGLMRVILHGGEPLLVDLAHIRYIITTLRKYAPKGATIQVSIQTNATRLTTEHLEMALELGDVRFSVSLDGNERGNKSRPFRNGNSSYQQVRESLLLFDNDRYRHLLAGLLCVMWPMDPSDPTVGNDPEETTAELMRYGVPFDYLFPITKWEPGTEPTERPVPTDTPYADWMLRAYRYWIDHIDSPATPGIRFVDQLLQLINCYYKGITVPWPDFTEVLGEWTPPAFCVETDRALEMLDGLNKVKRGESYTGLNVRDHTFTEALVAMIRMSEQRGIVEGSPICQSCDLFAICGGGHYLERYGPLNGYRNPSKYCADLQVLIRTFAAFYERDILAQPADSKK